MNDEAKGLPEIASMGSASASERRDPESLQILADDMRSQFRKHVLSLG